MSEVKKLNIYEKLLAITSEMQTVAKNLTIEMGKGKYKAVGEVDVINAVKPLEVKYGVYSYPVSRVITESKEITNKYDTINQFMRVETTYRFVNVENPSEYVDTITYGDGVDSQDKAPGKAMTYADKYALLKAYKVATGDDPDQTPSDEFKGKTITHATPKQIKTLKELFTDDRIEAMLQYAKVSKLEELTLEQASTFIEKETAKREKVSS